MRDRFTGDPEGAPRSRDVPPSAESRQRLRRLFQHGCGAPEYRGGTAGEERYSFRGGDRGAGARETHTQGSPGRAGYEGLAVGKAGYKGLAGGVGQAGLGGRGPPGGRTGAEREWVAGDGKQAAEEGSWDAGPGSWAAAAGPAAEDLGALVRCQPGLVAALMQNVAKYVLPGKTWQSSVLLGKTRRNVFCTCQNHADCFCSWRIFVVCICVREGTRWRLDSMNECVYKKGTKNCIGNHTTTMT